MINTIITPRVTPELLGRPYTHTEMFLLHSLLFEGSNYLNRIDCTDEQSSLSGFSFEFLEIERNLFNNNFMGRQSSEIGLSVKKYDDFAFSDSYFTKYDFGITVGLSDVDTPVFNVQYHTEGFSIVPTFRVDTLKNVFVLGATFTFDVETDTAPLIDIFSYFEDENLKTRFDSRYETSVQFNNNAT